VLAAFVSSRIAGDCSALLSPLGLDSVVEDFSDEPLGELCVDSLEPVEVPVPDDFGVDVVEGMFGGLPVEGNSGLFAPVPPFGAGIFGVLAVPGVTGVVGVLVVGVGVLVGGVPVVGIGACATVSVRGAGVLCLPSAAAPAAAAAPVSRIAISASVPNGRQFGRSPSRLPGWPAPHCRHHSWPSRSGASQLVQVRCAPDGSEELPSGGPADPPA